MSNRVELDPSHMMSFVEPSSDLNESSSILDRSNFVFLKFPAVTGQLSEQPLRSLLGAFVGIEISLVHHQQGIESPPLGRRSLYIFREDFAPFRSAVFQLGGRF